MTGITVISLYMLAGISAYAAFHHIAIALKPPRDRLQMLFAGICLSTVPFAIFHAQTLQAPNIMAFVQALKWNLASIIPIILIFCWFIALYTGKMLRPLLLGLTVLFAVLFAVNLVQPYSLQYDQVDGIRSLQLPWGEVVTRGIGHAGAWTYVASAAVMAVMAYALFALGHAYQLDRRRADLWMMLAVGLFLLSSLEGIFARLSVLDFIELGPFGILVLVMIMGSVLTGEMERRLRNPERHFRLLFENLPAGMVAIDPTNGRFVQANPFALKLTGYSAEEFFTKTVNDLTLPDDLEDSQQRFEKLSNGLIDYLYYEKHYVRKDGSSFLGYSSISTLRDDDGKVLRFIGSTIDITERKLAEVALRRESEKNRVFLHNASDGIHILDIDGNIIEVSDSFCSMLGYRRDEMIGMNISQWDVNLSGTRLSRQICQQFTKQGRSQFETCYRRKDGTVFDVEVTSSPLDLDSKPALFGSSRDITERKQLEAQELARVAALRDTLVREVQHRIKNTLQGVAALLRQQADESPEIGHALTKAITRIRTVAVVHGLQGQANTQIALCDMVRAITVVLREVTHLPLRLETAPHHRPVLLAETETVPIALIINELMFNAVKHTDTAQPDQAIHILLQGGEHEMRFVIHSVRGRLPEHFDFVEGRGFGTGLTLVKSLLPPAGAELSIVNAGGGVRTELRLTRPVLIHSNAVEADPLCL